MIPNMKAAFLELEQEEQQLNGQLANVEKSLMALRDKEHAIRTALTHIVNKRTRLDQLVTGMPA